MVGRFLADDDRSYVRGSRVVCRTSRGLEVGEVLTRQSPAGSLDELDGTLLRELSPHDESQLLDHLVQRDRAVEACQTLLDQTYAPVIVVDAVYPLDGQSICFYVLGDLGETLQHITHQLQHTLQVNVTFQSVVQEQPTHQTTGGCEAGGCGSAGCSSDSCDPVAGESSGEQPVETLVAEAPKRSRGNCSSGGCATCPAKDVCRRRSG